MGRPAFATCQQIITNQSSNQTIHIGTVTVISPDAPPFMLSYSHMGCNLAAAETSNTESSCATHGAFDTGDAICIPFLEFQLDPREQPGQDHGYALRSFRIQVRSANLAFLALENLPPHVACPDAALGAHLQI